MRIAITGGLGFIGLHLARRLINNGHIPLLIDALTPQIHGPIPFVELPHGIEVIRVDVRDLAKGYAAIDGCDAIFHLAAETGTGQSMYQLQQYVGVNDLGTAALFEGIAACKIRPKKIILASSRSVYGEGAYMPKGVENTIIYPRARTVEQMNSGNWDHLDDGGNALLPVGTKESAPFQPGSVYAATKAAQELLVQAAAPALGMKSVILRFQNVYGPGQSLRNPYTGIISIFFNKARQGFEIPLYEDGFESRDFVFVDDVVDALVLSLDADLPSGHVFNVGSGVATSVSELAKSLNKAAKMNALIRVTGQYRVGDIRHCFADISEAGSCLGWFPKTSLFSGLEKFSEWAIMQPIYEDTSARASEELLRNGLAGKYGN